MAEQSKGRYIILGGWSLGRTCLCNSISWVFYDHSRLFADGWSGITVVGEDAYQLGGLHRWFLRMREDCSPLPLLTAMQAKCITCDLVWRPSLRHLLSKAAARKAIHLDLPVNVLKKCLNKIADVVYTKHRENFTVQYHHNRRFVFIEASRLFVRRIHGIGTTVFESLRMEKKSLRICERFRKKLLPHLVNQTIWLRNGFLSEGARRKSGELFIPAF